MNVDDQINHLFAEALHKTWNQTKSLQVNTKVHNYIYRTIGQKVWDRFYIQVEYNVVDCFQNNSNKS